MRSVTITTPWNIIYPRRTDTHLELAGSPVAESLIIEIVGRRWRIDVILFDQKSDRLRVLACQLQATFQLYTILSSLYLSLFFSGFCFCVHCYRNNIASLVVALETLSGLLRHKPAFSALLGKPLAISKDPIIELSRASFLKYPSYLYEDT